MSPGSDPVVSIVVPVLNEARAIEARLTALAPLLRRGAELIVVDGGSVDGTPARAGPLADRVLRGSWRSSRHFARLFHAVRRIAYWASVEAAGGMPASRKALQRAGWNAADVDLFELNEAFAAQACAVNKELAIDPAKVNVNGGAIAIGHPIGASGCRILVTLLHEMQRRDAKKGLAALCIGGGMGVSLALER